MNLEEAMLKAVQSGAGYQEGDGCSVVGCLSCGGTNAHLMGVCVKQGDTITMITGKRTSTFPCGQPGERGSVVGVAYICESGCRFVVTQSFHKGDVYQRIHFVGSTSDNDLDEDTADALASWSELWRD